MDFFTSDSTFMHMQSYLSMRISHKLIVHPTSNLHDLCSVVIASFPGPTQLSIAFSTEKQEGKVGGA